MEHGFFHPEWGYWQTTNDPAPETLATYPKGTVRVPLKPSGLHEWNGSTWVEVPLPPPTEEEVRTKRDGLLVASDWTQVADAPVDQLAWATYRQALRDIPQQDGFPENVIWPSKPE